MEDRGFAVTLTKQEGYRFEIDFGLDGVPPLLTDEPAPLGGGEGPNPARLLAAAIGNCLAASLVFCLGRARIPVESLRVRVEGGMARNPENRLRIEGLSVTLEPVLPAGASIDRCLGIYEDFCIVTQSVRDGLDVDVRVEPAVSVEPAAA
jgi:uncharacterized OsmC-like protein